MGFTASKVKKKKKKKTRKSAPHSVSSQGCGTHGSSDPTSATLPTRGRDLALLPSFGASGSYAQMRGMRGSSPLLKAVAKAEECGVHMADINPSQSCGKEGSSDSSSTRATGTAHDSVIVSVSAHETTSQAASVTSRIELSKSHWSERVEMDCDSTDDVIARDNLEVFQTLQKHPMWGHFFQTFGYDTEVRNSFGEMVVGEKFAEGGQAELFHAHITWPNSEYNEYCEKEAVEWVLKVFKKGTLLRQLQSQWPHGYLEWWASDFEGQLLGYPSRLRWECTVMHGTLMRDGRFAFIMKRERGDLRSKIDENMLKCGNDVGPFSKLEAGEIMYHIAHGVEWLHKQNIIHQDIKASNVLVMHDCCYVADYECSVGVAGTELWRAPQILQACQDKTMNQR